MQLSKISLIIAICLIVFTINTSSAGGGGGGGGVAINWIVAFAKIAEGDQWNDPELSHHEKVEFPIITLRDMLDDQGKRKSEDTHLTPEQQERASSMAFEIHKFFLDSPNIYYAWETSDTDKQNELYSDLQKKIFAKSITVN
ncbi:MAG: hypothetical protein AAGB35_10005 [Pseudomonadota bacterium]